MGEAGPERGDRPEYIFKKMSRRKAFTLVELLISSAILAVIMITVYSAFYSGIFGYRDIGENIEISQEARLIFNRLNLDLQNSFSYSKTGSKFSGDKTNIAFLSLVDSFSEGEMITDYTYVAYKFEDERLERFLKKNKDALNTAVSAEVQEMADNIEDLYFNYGYSDAPENPLEWKEAWDTTTAMPSAVKVKIVFKGKSTYEFERVIFLKNGA